MQNGNGLRVENATNIDGLETQDLTSSLRQIWPDGIIVLQPGQIAEITIGRRGAFVFDVDDTLVLSTEVLYNGPAGSFAYVAREIYAEHGYLFADVDWEEKWNNPGGLRTCTGKNTKLDSKAFSDFLFADKQILVPEVDICTRVQKEQLRMLEEKKELFGLIDGAGRLISEGKRLGIDLALCSSSWGPMVEGLTQIAGVRGDFKTVVFEATKRFLCGTLNAEPTLTACRNLDAEPKASCMLGDSVGDVSAALAEYGGVVIRIPPSLMRDQTVIQFVESVCALTAPRDGRPIIGSQHCQVLIVEEYDEMHIKKSDTQERLSIKIIDVDSDFDLGVTDFLELPRNIDELVDPSHL